MRLGEGFLALAVCGVTMGPALGQGTSDYPSRGITMVMPLAAASAGDVLGRLVGAKMATDLGKHIVSENVTGASGAIGIDACCARRPTATPCSAPATTSSSMRRCSTRAPSSIRAAISPRSRSSRCWIGRWWPIRHSRPRRSASWWRSRRPSPARSISPRAASASAQQIAMELLMARSGIKLTHVPYRGVTPALNDVVFRRRSGDVHGGRGGHPLHSGPQAARACDHWTTALDAVAG